MRISNADSDLLTRAIRSHNMRALGKNTITNLSSARSLGYGLSAGIPAQVTRATIDVEGSSVRFWIDGSTPTSTEGHLLAAGDTITVENGNEVQNALFINVTSGASLQITFSGGSIE